MQEKVALARVASAPKAPRITETLSLPLTCVLGCMAALILAGGVYLLAELGWQPTLQAPASAFAPAVDPGRTLPARIVPLVRRNPPSTASKMGAARHVPRPAHVDAEGNCTLQGADLAKQLQACLHWYNAQL